MMNWLDFGGHCDLVKHNFSLFILLDICVKKWIKISDVLYSKDQR